MTEMQAALGLSQLDRIDRYVARRHELASYYDRMLAELPIVCPWQDARSYSSFHLYVVRLRLNSVARSHREVFDSLRKQEISVNLHYIPVYRQPYFREMGFPAGYCSGGGVVLRGGDQPSYVSHSDGGRTRGRR